VIARGRLRAVLSTALAFAALPLAADWRAVPLYGGDVRSLAVAPGDPDLVAAGTSSGQVYLSRDGAATWTLPGPRVALPGWVVSDLVFDPHAPERLWAALWSVWGSEGLVVVSEDLGATWTPRSEGLPGSQVYRLALAPDRKGLLYAATREGVWGTTTDAANWRELTAALTGMGKVTSLLVDPYDADIVYAGTWRRAYRSDDRGFSWRPIFDGMVLDSEVFTLRPGTGGVGDLWASTCGWVYHGVGRGSQWRRHEQGMSERRTPALEILPDGRVLAGTVAGIYLSDDAGASFRRVTSPDLTLTDIAFHRARPERVLAATEGAGVWRSLDGGETFEPTVAGMTSLRVTDLATSGPDILLAVRDAGKASGVHRADPLDLDLASDGAPLPAVLDLAAEGELLYAATERGLWERRDGTWRRLPELGEGRVEEVATGGTGIAARTADGVWVRREGTFEPVPPRAGSPRRIQWVGSSLWITDERGIYAADGLPVAAPPGAVQLLGLGERSLWTGSQGVWVSAKATGEPPWQRLAARPARALATGDPDYPVLFLGEGEEGMLYHRSLKGLSLELPVATQDVAAALLARGRLFVGTPGNGLLYADMLEVE
jgi:hypothetical protein